MKRKIFITTVLLFSLFYGYKGFTQKAIPDLHNVDFKNGEIVISDDATIKSRLTISQKSYEEGLLGVFVKPEYVPKENGEPTLIPKSLVKTEGIVMVRYNSENGIINKGDWVTSSSEPGVAMKSIQPGMVLGVALEDAKESSGFIRIRILLQYIQ